MKLSLQIICFAGWGRSWINLNVMKDLKYKPAKFRGKHGSYCRIRWVKDTERKKFGIVNLETL